MKQLFFSLLLIGSQSFAISAATQSALLDFSKLVIQEAREGVAPNHQSQLLFVDSNAKKSVLILHGLNESPNYMNGWAEIFSQRGYNVVSILLPGHQRADRKTMTTVKAEDWITAAKAGFEIAKGLGEEVTVLGYSTGGTLATYLTLENSLTVEQLILIAPALKLRFKVTATSKLLGKTHLRSDHLCTDPTLSTVPCKLLAKGDDQIPDMVREGIVSAPALGNQVYRLTKILSPMMKSADIKIPVLLINSDADNVTNPRFSEKYFAEIPSNNKMQIYYPEGLGLKHIYISKFPVDAFEKTENGYNKYHREMGDILGLFLDSNAQ